MQFTLVNTSGICINEDQTNNLDSDFTIEEMHAAFKSMRANDDTRKTRDPNFRGVSNWKFHSRMYFGELQPFFPFSIMADTNFPFLLTLGKLETQTLGEVINWKFHSRTNFLLLSTLGKPETQALGGQ